MPPGCPRCQAPLVPGLQAPPRHSSCPRRHGVWVEASEMRRALTLPAQAAFDNATRDAREGTAPCPGCATPMRVVTVERHGDRVELDACPRCHGCWLDEGELERVRRPAPSVRAADAKTADAAPARSKAFSGGGDGRGAADAASAAFDGVWLIVEAVAAFADW